jgi:hypothetical protein
MSVLLHATHKFLHNLLIVLVHIANKMKLYKTVLSDILLSVHVYLEERCVLIFRNGGH